MDKWLGNTTSLKITSVVIAIIIWAVVHIDPATSPQSITSNTDTKIIEATSIVPVGLDTDKYVLTAMEPTVARLVVEGRISTLKAATLDDYVVQLDLSNVEPGIQDLPLTVKLPKGVTEVDLSPRVVTVKIEELETKTLEVQVLTEGEPAEGYLVGESSIIGDTGNVVEVTMPKDDFEHLDKVAVTVNIADAKETVVNKKAKIVAYDTQGAPISNVTFNPETLSAQTIITLPDKEVPIQLRYSGSLPEGYSLVSISTDQNLVKLHALQSTLDTLTMYDGFIVDLSKVKESGEITVKSNLQDGITGVVPAEIPVKVVIEPTSTRLMNDVPITVNGLSNDYALEIDNYPDRKMDVMLQGAETLLQRVRLSDVKLTLDVSSLTAGTHKLAVAVELPAYIQADVSGEYKLDVTVTLTDKRDLETMTTPDDNDVTSTEPPASGPGNESGALDEEDQTTTDE